MSPDTIAYNEALDQASREICELLAQEIEAALPEAENKVWHAHPVWFLDGNPVVGYSRLKGGDYKNIVRNKGQLALIDTGGSHA